MPSSVAIHFVRKLTRLRVDRKQRCALQAPAGLCFAKNAGIVAGEIYPAPENGLSSHDILLLRFMNELPAPVDTLACKINLRIQVEALKDE